MMSMIILFCGPPASGKSAIAKRLAEALEGSKLVSSDEFRRKTYDHMFAETEKWAGRVNHLILDGTFYRREWREKVREISREKGENILTIYITCSLETCLERNMSRKERIEEKAIHIIHKQFERPEAPDLIIDTDALGMDEAVERILKALPKSV
jgi:adenylylsulfate kinase-like enzyme